MQHKDFEKKLLALQREEKSLWAQKQALGWAELKPPIMRGWKRYFVLREDVARSKHAAFFDGILSKINSIEYSNRKDFKKKKRKGGKKIYIERTQSLLWVDECEFGKFKFSEKEMSFFEARLVLDQWAKHPRKKYIFLEPWRFVLRVRPNMFTKVRVRDEKIESRLNEIGSYLERNALNGKLLKLLYGNKRWRWYDYEREWEKNPFKDKSVTAILNEINLDRL